MPRAQGAIEYLVIVAAVLTIAAIVTVFMSGLLSGQSSAVSINACKQASVDCKASRLLAPVDPCSQCIQACTDSKGAEVFAGAIYCCNTSQSNMIYSGSPGCGGGTTTCSDGTALDTCKTTKPKYCPPGGGQLTDTCSICGCPSGQVCTAGGTCSAACSDGTPVSQCSTVIKGEFCTLVSGQPTLIDSCSTCGCIAGETCGANGMCTGIPTVCLDETPLGSCSATKPKICRTVQGFPVLVDECSTCGCPANKDMSTCGGPDGKSPCEYTLTYSCSGTGSCSSSQSGLSCSAPCAYCCVIGGGGARCASGTSCQ